MNALHFYWTYDIPPFKICFINGILHLHTGILNTKWMWNMMYTHPPTHQHHYGLRLYSAARQQTAWQCESLWRPSGPLLEPCQGRERESAEGRETLHSFSKKSYSFVHPLSFRLSLSGAHWSHKPHESSNALARLMSAWLCFFSTIKFWLSFRTVMRDMNLNIRSSAHTLVQYCRMRLWEDFHICICSYITCLVCICIYFYYLFSFIALIKKISFFLS